MIGASAGGGVAAVNKGGAKGVPFSRVVTLADAAFATITVSLPRSSKPVSLLITITAGAALVQVQGNGPELFAATVAVNTPVNLPLDLPESIAVNVQVEQLAASTLAGVLFYQ